MAKYYLIILTFASLSVAMDFDVSRSTLMRWKGSDTVKGGTHAGKLLEDYYYEGIKVFRALPECFPIIQDKIRKAQDGKSLLRMETVTFFTRENIDKLLCLTDFYYEIDPDEIRFKINKKSAFKKSYQATLKNHQTFFLPKNLFTHLEEERALAKTGELMMRIPINLFRKGADASILKTHPIERFHRSKDMTVELDEAKALGDIGEEKRLECELCMEREKNTAFSPCGHVVCAPCSEKYIDCPTCRQKIIERLKLHF